MQIFLALCTVATLFFARETPLTQKEVQGAGDAAPLLFEEGNSPSAHASVIQVITTDRSTAHQSHGFGPKQTGTDLSTRGQDPPKNESNDGHDDEGSIRPGTVLVNLLVGIHQLPSSMKSVLLVMAFCWVCAVTRSLIECNHIFFSLSIIVLCPHFEVSVTYSSVDAYLLLHYGTRWKPEGLGFICDALEV